MLDAIEFDRARHLDAAIVADAYSPIVTPCSSRGDTLTSIELMPGLILMIGQNRGDVVRRLANEIWQRYGSAVR